MGGRMRGHDQLLDCDAPEPGWWITDARGDLMAGPYDDAAAAYDGMEDYPHEAEAVVEVWSEWRSAPRPTQGPYWTGTWPHRVNNLLTRQAILDMMGP